MLAQANASPQSVLKLSIRSRQWIRQSQTRAAFAPPSNVFSGWKLSGSKYQAQKKNKLCQRIRIWRCRDWPPVSDWQSWCPNLFKSSGRRDPLRTQQSRSSRRQRLHEHRDAAWHAGHQPQNAQRRDAFQQPPEQRFLIRRWPRDGGRQRGAGQLYFQHHADGDQRGAKRHIERGQAVKRHERCFRPGAGQCRPGFRDHGGGISR